ncbi:MAG: FAD-binding oxidoreductase, partial [Anaerolineae bacterium]|nr:FAD-binding oxidoreductase [Anaerolineae bacterium]
IRLSLESLPMIERFPDELGQNADYRPIGYLFLLTNPEDVATFERNVTLQHSLGVMTEWLSGDQIRQRLPMMALEDVIGGTFHAKDGLVDPNSVVMGYINAAQRLGAKAYNQVEVTGIRQAGGKVSGVETSQGVISAPVVINCAGPWVGLVGKMAGIDIPVTPIRRQMMVTTPLPQIPPDFPFVIDFAQSLYFHPESSGILTGMSNQNEKPGFDQNVDQDFELVNLEASIKRLPLLEQAGLASHWAGLYEVTPDAHPIYGVTPLDGFYLVGGFSGHGFMHGPVSGKLISEIILDGQAATVDVSMLDLARFSENRLIHEYNVV